VQQQALPVTGRLAQELEPPQACMFGTEIGGGIAAAIGALAMGVHGADEGSGVGRDFGNAVWDVTHSGPISDRVAGVAGAVWGFIRK
jgi:hypothetical protein